jgi:oxygen-independent coproporphyrinogen-3 oxidase
MVLALNALERQGFERYEVANYARSRDSRSRHNTAYWTGRSYIGIGPAAHGMLDAATARAVSLFPYLGPEVARVRYGNAPSIEDWLLARGDSLEMLGQAEALREDAMLGLRLTEGITDRLAEKAGVVTVLEELSASGLVEHVGKRWRTTRSGWLLGNEVFGRVWSGE